jgi:hypothetical protein
MASPRCIIRPLAANPNRDIGCRIAPFAAVYVIIGPLAADFAMFRTPVSLTSPRVGIGLKRTGQGGRKRPSWALSSWLSHPRVGAHVVGFPRHAPLFFALFHALASRGSPNRALADHSPFAKQLHDSLHALGDADFIRWQREIGRNGRLKRSGDSGEAG